MAREAQETRLKDVENSSFTGGHHTSPPTPTEPTELSVHNQSEIAFLVAECAKLLQVPAPKLIRLYQQLRELYRRDHQGPLLIIDQLLDRLEHHAKIPDLSGLGSDPQLEPDQSGSEPSESATGDEIQEVPSRIYEEAGEFPDQLWPPSEEYREDPELDVLTKHFGLPIKGY